MFLIPPFPISQPALHPPVPEAAFPALAVLLTSAGLTSGAALYVYESTRPRAARMLATEATLAAATSVALGVGLFFLMLWSGLYV